MSILSGIAKVLAKAGAKLGAATAKVAPRLGSSLGKVAVKLNKVWIGAGAALVGVLGIKWSNDKSIPENVWNWLTGTDQGILCLAIIVLAVVLYIGTHMPARHRSGGLRLPRIHHPAKRARSRK